MYVSINLHIIPLFYKTCSSHSPVGDSPVHKTGHYSNNYVIHITGPKIWINLLFMSSGTHLEQI